MDLFYDSTNHEIIYADENGASYDVRVIAWELLSDPTHWWTPAGQILGGPDPCDHCGIDAYDTEAA